MRDEISRLPRGWYAAHAVTDGSEPLFDHVVVGPAGVFVLLTERHRGGHATVYRHMLYVDGHPLPVIANARAHAHLAGVALSDACGRSVDVQSVIVLVDLDSVDVQHQPHRPVHVLASHELADWLVHRRDRWPEDTVAQVFGRVRDGTTWRT